VSIYEEINTKIALPDYMTHCGLDLKDAGAEFKCRCFVHDDQNPSMSIYEKDGKWQYYCHTAGCEATGDVIDFHATYYDVTQKTAIEALRAYGHIAGGNGTGKTKRDLDSGRRLVQKYLVDNLRNNEDAMNILKGRGVSVEIADRWGIGLTGPDMYNHFKKIFEADFKNSNDLLLYMIQVGVAKKRKTDVGPTSWFREGRFSIPFMHGIKITQWFFRDITGKSGGPQCPNDIRDPACQWFNQKRINESEVFVTEGPWDAIALEEHGYPAMALAGYSKAKANMLRETFQPNEYFEELTKKTKVNIMLDRDENQSGQQLAVKMARYICGHCECVLYQLPQDVDIDEYLYKGGKVEDLEKKPWSAEPSAVIVQDGKYWLQKGDELVQISNFTIKRKYAFRTKDGKTRYDVHVVRSDGMVSQLATIDGTQLSSMRDFRIWLYDLGCDFVYDGDVMGINEIVKHMATFEVPKHIDVFNAYGNVEEGIWLADNGAIVNGNMIWADEDGIIQMPDGKAVKTSLGGGNYLNLRFPEEAWTPAEIVTKLLGFYGREFTWRMLGFVTACYYHKTIRGHYRQFPLAACFGPTRRGKTSCATVIGSLMSCGNIGNPTGRSTAKGISRLMSLLHNFPVVVNEFEAQRLDPLVRTIYDGDIDVTAKRTIGDDVFVRSVNTSLILTQETVPQDPSVVNRLVLFDFFKFHQSTELYADFNDFEEQGIIQSKNAGWLFALTKCGGEERIIDDIRYSQDKLTKVAVKEGREIDARQLKNSSIVFGSLLNAFRELNLNAGLESPIEPSEVMGSFIGSLDTATALSQDRDPLKVFFETFERMVLDEKIVNHFMIDQELRKSKHTVPGRMVLKVNIKHVFELVQQEERRGSNRLPYISAKDICSAVHMRWNISPQSHGKFGWGYKIPVETLRHDFGVTFEAIAPEEDSKEAENAAM